MDNLNCDNKSSWPDPPHIQVTDIENDAAASTSQFSCPSPTFGRHDEALRILVDVVAEAYDQRLQYVQVKSNVLIRCFCPDECLAQPLLHGCSKIVGKVMSDDVRVNEMKLYHNCLSVSVPNIKQPHLYKLCFWAKRKAYNIRRWNQAILLHGQTGTGKSESLNDLLGYLCITSPTKTMHGTKQAQLLFWGLHYLVDYHYLKLVFNSAFGSASTVECSCATRMGQFIELYLDFKGDVVGSCFTLLPLEKWRVTEPLSNRTRSFMPSAFTPGLQQNFFIFYLLLSGADVQLLKLLKLQRNPHSYALLTQQCMVTSRYGEQNKDLFTQIKHSLDEFLGELSQDVWLILAAILKLGNLVFESSVKVDGTPTCVLQNSSDLRDACTLLGCDTGAFLSALLQRNQQRDQHQSRSSSSLDLSSLADVCREEAIEWRNRICQQLYGRLMHVIVTSINETLKPAFQRNGGVQNGALPHTVLSMLDYFGFENLENNHFEQLLVNYANERIRAFMIERELKEECEMYICEEINLDALCSPEHQVVIYDATPMIDRCLASVERLGFQKGSELLATLPHLVDRVKPCVTPRSHSYTHGIDGHHASDSCDQRHMSFTVRHFLGEVTYSTADFESKNQNFLRPELVQLFEGCSVPLVRMLFPEGSVPLVKQQQQQETNCPTVSKALSCIAQFKIALNTVLSRLAFSECYHVISVLPDTGIVTARSQFNVDFVGAQLSAFCAEELYNMGAECFSEAFQLESFVVRYRMLTLSIWPTSSSLPVLTKVHAILKSQCVMTSEYAIGKSKLFIRNFHTVTVLEARRERALNRLACLIQRLFRSSNIHSNKHHLSALIITGWFRAVVIRRVFIRKRNAVTVLSKHWRGLKARRLYRHLRRIMCARRICRFLLNRCRRKFLYALANNLPSESPVSELWPTLPGASFICAKANSEIRVLFHRWRCRNYRLLFDQQTYFRMREKLTASMIFKDHKVGYQSTISHPFRGDYVRIRQNAKWKRVAIETGDDYVVFADIVSKIHRSSGKVTSVLLVISTNGIVVLDSRSIVLKYRVPVVDCVKISLSPYCDTVAVIHLKNGFLSKKRGDFLLECRHIIELLAKLYLVVQNATGKAPSIDIASSVWLACEDDQLELVFQPSSDEDDVSEQVGGCFSSSARILRSATRSTTTTTTITQGTTNALQSKNENTNSIGQSKSTTPNVDGIEPWKPLNQHSYPVNDCMGGYIPTTSDNQTLRFLRRSGRLEVHF